MRKIEQLQRLVAQSGLQAYIVPTSDYHQSEYISDHFKIRQFVTGFTGSAGTLVVTPSDARLWVDGRYYIQAANEVAGNGIKIMQSGQPGVPTIIEFLQNVVTPTGKYGFDGRLISAADFINYKKRVGENIDTDVDLISRMWVDRPELPFSMIYSLDDFLTGEPSYKKINRLRAKMKESRAQMHIITSLEDQAWLFNLRGSDIAYSPLFLSYTVITMSEIYLFVNKAKLNDHVKSLLENLKVTILQYDDIYDFIRNVSGYPIMVDPNKLNARIYQTIVEKNKIILKQNPTLLMKAIKNESEINQTKKAHILDGVAFTKLMYYLKSRVGSEEMTEMSVQNYLEKLRRKNESLIDLSFSTICAYKANAAMMHYNASSYTNQLIKDEGLLLIDSGGHYLEGTTDITRTVSMGKPKIEEKEYFTTVLKSMISLTDTIFLKGCTGQALDIKARDHIWKKALDYKCGTGHGVGHILSVHEGPQSFRYNAVPDKNGTSELVPGMIITNEPGIYLEGELGIRIENELLVVPHTENKWGTFYTFETITYAPIDLDLVEKQLLTSDEVHWLNAYHDLIYNKISPYLGEEEEKWLRYYTRKI